MIKKYRTPIVLFLLVIILGLGLHALFDWWYPRWQANLAKEALRRYHIALEERYLKYYQYPEAIDQNGKKIKFQNGYTLGFAPWTLLPENKMAGRVFKHAKQTYYCSDGNKGWILCHAGPDGRLDTDLKAWIKDASGELSFYCKIHPEGLIEYDPSNGTLSRGDVLRTGP